jgi:hypothetical protein
MSASAKYPQLVMIIRHGEKPGSSKQESKGGPDLSLLGSARAAALPSLFTPDPTVQPSSKNAPQQLACNVTAGKANQFAGTYSSSGLPAGSPRFPTPNYLFATHHSKNSNRPVETITPLSQALASLNNPGIHSKIHHHYPDASYKALAKEILNTPQTYGGKVILICWHHGKAPNLAEALGVSKQQIAPWKPWNPEVFDLVFQITWDSSGQANLAVGYQQLLFNDTKES